jgi:hypothetical protein
MPIDDPAPVKDLLPAPDLHFSLELLGATVTCRVTTPAIDTWRRKQQLVFDAPHGVYRVAKEVLYPILRQAGARPGERWGAWFGADAVALMIDDG